MAPSVQISRATDGGHCRPGFRDYRICYLLKPLNVTYTIGYITQIAFGWFFETLKAVKEKRWKRLFFFAFIPPIDQTTRAELYLSVMISRSISFPCCESPSAFILVRSAAQEVNPVHPSVILIEMVRPLETVCRTFRQKDTQMKSFIFGRISKISYPSLRVNIYRRSLHRNVESPLRVNCSRLQTCEHIHRTRPL